MESRYFLMEPGESLIGPRDPDQMSGIMAEFLDETGLEPDEVAWSYFASLPIPRYPAEWPLGRNRWAGIKPEVMWHPLFWLPDRVAGRYVFVDSNGNRSREDLDDWTARVCLELTNAGLYNPETGGWSDILSVHGIDIENPNDLERIQEWLDGAQDDVLDNINLEKDFTVEDDPHLMLDVVSSARDDLQAAAWLCVSAAAEQGLGAVIESEVPASERVQFASMWASIVAEAMHEEPDLPAMSAKWDRIYDQWTGDTEGANVLLEAMQEDMKAIYARYNSRVEELAEAFASEELPKDSTDPFGESLAWE